MTVTGFIGTSGWHYPHWQGRYYPDELPASDWLAFYSRMFDTVEINASFYRLPSAAAVRSWVRSTPPDFVFALKVSRLITHWRKLRAPRVSTRGLLRVARGLGAKCGPILFQLPPRWRCDVRRLARFLRALPRDFDYAFEFRDRSWHRPDVYALLKRHRAAFCLFQLAGFDSPHVLTADFAYVRLHGPEAAAYRGSYTKEALERWAREIRRWERVRRVFVYFDNDAGANAVDDAIVLKQLLARRGVPR